MTDTIALTSTRATGRGTTLTLALLLLLVALPLRLFTAENAAMMSRDGATFIWYAQRLAVNPVGEMRAQDQHPLYPAMILATHTKIQLVRQVFPGWLADPVLRWEAAAVAVSFVGGLMVVLGVYAVSFLLFDTRVAMIAALLAAVAVEFCQLSGDALSDMPHLAFYLFALAAGLRAVQLPGTRLRFVLVLALAGALSGLAFLVRPEGAEVAVVLVAALLLIVRRVPFRDRILGILAVCLGAAIVAGPYMLTTGKLVKKKPITQFIADGGPGSRNQTAETQRAQRGRAINQPFSLRPLRLCGPIFLSGAQATVGYCHEVRTGLRVSGVASSAVCPCRTGLHVAGRVMETWYRSLRVTLLLPAIVWLIWRKRVPAESLGARVVLSAVSLHLTILFLLVTRFDYQDLLSVRHAMVLAALTLPFSAAGVAMVLDRVQCQRQRLATVLLLAALIGPTLPYLFRANGADSLPVRRAGEWIRSQSPDSPRILTTRNLAVYYAGGVSIWSPKEADAARILAEARANRPEWMIFEKKRLLRENPAFFDELARTLRPDERLDLVHEELHAEAKDSVLIYRYLIEE